MMISVIVTLSDSLFNFISSFIFSEWVSEVEVDSATLNVSSLPVAAPLYLSSHSVSASINCCFKDLVMLYLTLSLLLIVPRGVQFLLVFVRDAGHFSLMFRVSPDLSVSRVGIF